MGERDRRAKRWQRREKGGRKGAISARDRQNWGGGAQPAPLANRRRKTTFVSPTKFVSTNQLRYQLASLKRGGIMACLGWGASCSIRSYQV